MLKVLITRELSSGKLLGVTGRNKEKMNREKSCRNGVASGKWDGQENVIFMTTGRVLEPCMHFHDKPPEVLT